MSETKSGVEEHIAELTPQQLKKAEERAELVRNYAIQAVRMASARNLNPQETFAGLSIAIASIGETYPHGWEEFKKMTITILDNLHIEYSRAVREANKPDSTKPEIQEFTPSYSIPKPEGPPETPK